MEPLLSEDVSISDKGSIVALRIRYSMRTTAKPHASRAEKEALFEEDGFSELYDSVERGIMAQKA